MNIAHRSVWNGALGAWVAVSETTRRHGPRSGATVAVAAGTVLALGLLMAPASGWAQHHGATGGASGGGDAAATGAQAGDGPSGGAAGTAGSPEGEAGSSGGGAGYSPVATGDVNAAQRGGRGGDGSAGGGGGGDGVRITPSAPGVALSVNAAVTGSTGGFGGAGGGGGGGGAGVVLIGNNDIVTRAAIRGGAGGIGLGASSGGGGGGAGLVLQGGGEVSAQSSITGGVGGAGTSPYTSGNGGVGVLLVNYSTVVTAAAATITGGSSTGVGHGGAGISLLNGGTVTNAGAIRGGNGGGLASGGVAGDNGGVGSGGALGYVSGASSGGAPGGAGIVGAGIGITNSGTIAGGTAPGRQTKAIHFTGGSNSLLLQTGSVISGAIEVGTGATASLTADNAGLSVGDVILNGALTVQGAQGLAITGTVSGTAGLIKNSSGDLSLNGDNSYSGATALNAGRLILGTNSALGNGRLNAAAGTTLHASTAVSITNAVNLAGTTDIGGTFDLTLNGSVNGAGALTKNGGGTLTLNAANGYLGGTRLNSGRLTLGDADALGLGSLTVGADGTLDSNKALSIANNVSVGNFRTLTVDSSHALELSGVVSGLGGLNKTGNAALTLSGANTLSGATSVNAGTLIVKGSLARSVLSINNGATLAGSGAVSSTHIATGATLAPGNSIGTLKVLGNLSFAPGSFYRVDVDADGRSDLTEGVGNAVLDGRVDVLAAPGAYAADTTYTILTVAGTLTGRFTGATSDLAFLTPTLAYDANNVYLNLQRNGVAFDAPTVAITPNQIATAKALQDASTGAAGDMAAVTGALTGLSAAQARAAYDSASGAGLVALRRSSASFAATLKNQMFDRLNTANGPAAALARAQLDRPVLLAAHSQGAQLAGLLNSLSDTPPERFAMAPGGALPSASASPGRGFWLRASGGKEHTKSDGNAAASEQRNTALSAGFDAQLPDGLVLGAALNRSHARLGFDNSDTGKSHGTALAVYGSYAAGPWAFKAAASAGWNSHRMDRAVAVGALNRLAKADFDSQTLSTYGEAVYSLPMKGWTLLPVAALSISHDKADGFTETGADALNLRVAGQSFTSSKSLLGVKANFAAGRVRIEPRAIWAHEFGDLNKPMAAQLQGAATASPFQVAGVALKRDSLILGLGAAGAIAQGVDLFADVQLEHNARQRQAAVMLGLRASW